ncbi:reverse transcriptase domain-containing protein [Tanacetum coccineum]
MEPQMITEKASTGSIKVPLGTTIKGRKKDRERFSPYKGSNHGLLANLSKSRREILVTQKIEEAVKLGKLAHLVKGIRNGKAKALDTQLGERKKEDKDIVPAETHILMINPVITKVCISRRQVNQTYIDSGSSCEVIYEHCFFKLNSSTKALWVELKIPLIGFLGEQSWPLKAVPLEVTIRESPYTRIETLNFFIVRSDSPYNLLLGMTTMQKMGIAMSIIHETIKFYTPYRIGTMPSTYESNKVKEGQKC